MSTPLVAFDATATQRARGPAGRSALEMLRALVLHDDDPPRLRVLFSGLWGLRGPEHTFLDQAPTVQVVTSARPRDWLAAGWRKGTGPGPEALFGPDVAIAFSPAGVPMPAGRAKRVVWVSDADDVAALAGVDRIVAPLESIKRALVADGRVEAARIDVAAPAIDASVFFVENERLVEAVRHDLAILVPSFLVGLCDDDDGQRCALLLDAYAELRRRQPATPPLVVLGWGSNAPAELRARPELHRHVLPVEPRDEVVLRGVLTGAVACIDASAGARWRRDGLEAQACGSPVVASTEASSEELFGGSALLVDGAGVGAWADAIESVAFDRARREEFKQRGLKNAARFRWGPVVGRLMQVWRAL